MTAAVTVTPVTPVVSVIVTFIGETLVRHALRVSYLPARLRASPSHSRAVSSGLQRSASRSAAISLARHFPWSYAGFRKDRGGGVGFEPTGCLHAQRV